MTDKKSSESRRKLLKSIAAGSGAIVAGKSLPDKWTAPVVDTVMLPAHAQTSPAPTTTAAPTTTVEPCGTLTITSITRGQGDAQQPFSCGDDTDAHILNFSFNVAPVPPAGTTVTLNTVACGTASPAPVDGNGNATMVLDLSTCLDGDSNTYEFSIDCGSSVTCTVGYFDQPT